MTSARPRTLQVSAADHVADFADFYLATAKSTFRIARRVAGGDEHVAHDATQEAYARMLRRWDTLCRRSLADNRAYAARAAINLVVDHYRRHQRLTKLEDECDPGFDDTNLAAVLDEMTTLQPVRDLIERQPVRRRAVAALLFLEDYDISEIAEILDMTPSTVRTHVQRLRTLLRPFLSRVTEIDQGGELS